MRVKKSKKLLAVILALVMVITSVPITYVAAAGGGNATAGDTVLIGTAEELAAFRDRVNAGEGTLNAKLTADIDLSSVCGEGIGNWKPIGASNNTLFSGTFDGDGYEISKLYIKDGGYYQGLFGLILNDGVVKNVGVTDSIIYGETYVGIIAGANSGSISNCYATGTIGNAKDYIAGIVGNNGGTIENCWSDVNVSGGTCNGGIAGSNNETGTIKNCYSLGKITSRGSSGGICGNNTSPGEVINSYYLEASAAFGIGVGSGEATVKTEAELKSADFVTLLNPGDESAFAADKFSQNGGYPVLKWQLLLPNGSGTEDDPYLIANAKQLKVFADLVNAGDASICGRLTADIDLSSVCGESIGNWTPIGTGTLFSGTFDGDGYEISKLYIKDGGYHQGLFGTLLNDGVVKNVGVTDSIVYGETYVGIIVSRNGGSISNCYATGTISDAKDYIGGITGENGGTIENCWSYVNVSGGTCNGGIAGGNNQTGIIENCYSLGKITSRGSSGGICGDNTSSGEVINSYYLETSAAFGIGVGAGEATAKTADDMKSVDFVKSLQGTQDKNAFFKDLYNENGGYPILRWQSLLQNGSGTEDDPYLIANAKQLKVFADLVNAGDASICGRLTADIDLSSVCGEGIGNWTPIGNSANIFTGTFDGNGNVISKLYIKDGGHYQGLFGYNAGTIKNAGVADSYVSGSEVYVGGVCGRNYGGTIEGCYYTGEVGGEIKVGGIAGSNNETGTIKSCYNTGTVSGTAEVGGVCGFNGGTITSCYYTGEVGKEYSYNGDNIGGVCGYNTGTIENCYNTGTVNGAESVGGICGYNDATIESCYNYNTEIVTGTTFVGEICGANYGTITNNYYLVSGDLDDRRNGIGSDFGLSESTALTFDKITGINAVSNMKLDTTVWFATANKEEAGGIVNNEQLYNVTTYYLPQLKVFASPLELSIPEGSITFTRMQIKDGFYLIYTAEQLKTFANIVNNTLTDEEKAKGYTANTAANGKLMNDIDLSSVCGEGIGNWTPIGNSANKFTGTFDGDGYKISKLYIKDGGYYQGLFGCNAGTIKNAGVADSYVSGSNNVGGVCGDNYGTITDCYNTGTVSGTDEVGGVCAFNRGIIENSYNTGAVSGSNNVGGVCGWNYAVIEAAATIESCYNTGAINGNYYVSGVCGWNYADVEAAATIENSYNTGEVIGDGNVGGVCGYNTGAGTIESCYNTGKVSCKIWKVGGVCGSNYGTVTNCYNTGAVSGRTYVSGVCGDNCGTITNTYYLDTSVDTGIGDGGAGAAAKTIAEFENGNVLRLLITSADTPWDSECKHLLYADGKPVVQPVFTYQNLGINEPEYIVVIPESVNVGESFNITASASQMMQSQKVNVTVNIPSDGFALSNKVDPSVKNYVSLSRGGNVLSGSNAQLAEFANGANQTGDSLCFNGAADARAGKYQGSAVFNIYIKEGAA